MTGKSNLWAAQSKTAALFIHCRFPPSSFGFVSHGESWAGPQGKVIECFHRCILPAYILRWHESNDFTGCVTLVLDLGNRNPLCLENFTNASSSKEENKQQCHAIFCLRKWVFSGMAKTMWVEILGYLELMYLEIFFDCRWNDRK